MKRVEHVRRGTGEIEMRMGAEFSLCRTWRYRLWRVWSGSTDPIYVNFLMLNPSTADETNNDPTVERCQRRAMRWGFDGLVVTNIFAYRATDPLVMKRAVDPIGPDNDKAILGAGLSSSLVVCAWGKDGKYRGRAEDVCRLLRGNNVALYALKISKENQPCHPLYLSYDLTPELWKG